MFTTERVNHHCGRLNESTQMPAAPYNLNPDQQRLLARLQHPPILNRPPSWKRTKYEFVLEYGYWYEPAPRPKGIRLGRENRCFVNAFKLAQDNPDLIYCEGFCLATGSSLLIHHAWATDGSGRVIDNTLREMAAAYAGVPFRIQFLNANLLKNRAVICLLDDYLHEWPMLHELGDKPKLWYEEKGQGVARLVVR